MRKGSLEKAHAPIVEFFEKSAQKVFQVQSLRTILEQNRTLWGIASSVRPGKFAAYLMNRARLKEVRLTFPQRQQRIYTWGELEPRELATGLKPTGYLTHYSAMSLHGLTDQIPRTVYLNTEQGAKLQGSVTLEQRAIDAGFRCKPRVSSNVTEYSGVRIYLLNGKHTGGLGVVQLNGEHGQILRVTGIERTLIDIAVRPFYSGGVFEVLEAYRRAKGKVNLASLANMLKTLEYVYPYHQVIGFYLEKADCYSVDEVDSMRAFGLKHDFYLTHQMKNPEYSSRWRLYFPQGF